MPAAACDERGMLLADYHENKSEQHVINRTAVICEKQSIEEEREQ
jgi:hypothetical protein